MRHSLHTTTIRLDSKNINVCTYLYSYPVF